MNCNTGWSNTCPTVYTPNLANIAILAIVIAATVGIALFALLRHRKGGKN